MQLSTLRKNDETMITKFGKDSGVALLKKGDYHGKTHVMLNDQLNFTWLGSASSNCNTGNIESRPQMRLLDLITTDATPKTQQNIAT